MAESKKKPASVARLLRRIAELEGDVEALRQQSAALVRTNESTAAESAAHKRTAEVAANDATRWRRIVERTLDVLHPRTTTHEQRRAYEQYAERLPETVRELHDDECRFRGDLHGALLFKTRAENALRRARALIDNGDHRVTVETIGEIDEVLRPGAPL